MSPIEHHQLADMPLEERVQLEARLLARLRNRPAGGIPVYDGDEPVPLSFSQERLWFLAQLYPGQTTYNESSAYRLRGPLDTAALQAALSHVVERHSVLRTTYHATEGGGPQQIARDGKALSLAVEPLPGLPDARRLEAAQARFPAVIDAPFDLGRDLMVRCHLFRFDPADHLLLVVRHHIASDGWSSRLFWNELWQAYGAVLTDTMPDLPALPIQYADYAVWQRTRLQGDRLQRRLDYWTAQLSALPPLQLPTDRPRPDLMSHRGGGIRFKLDASLVRRLRRLARAESTTLHTVLMTAYFVLLARTTLQDDLAVGMPVAGRIRTELEPLLGFFVNTLVIRARCRDTLTFRMLLQQVRSTLYAALEHQDLPFEKLVEALVPERTLNRTPLISTTFQLFDLPSPEPVLPDIHIQPVDVPNLHAKFEMECSLRVEEGGIVGHWRYAVDLFDAATIRRMSQRYQTLLAGIVDDMELPIGRLPVLDADEHRLVTEEWRRSEAVRVPQVATAHQLFEEQAARTPDASAVVAAEGELTYAQLNQRANQLARRLQEMGVGPESTVGLCLERSLNMAVAYLAVLKAGGAVVPLDPGAPPARLLQQIEDAAPVAILAASAIRLETPAVDLPVLRLDHISWRELARQGNPDVRVGGNNAAYVLYTSGSTGLPKGVVVEHEQLLAYVSAVAATYGMTGGGVFAMVQPLTVDSCHTLIFTAWGWGGTLHLIDRACALDPVALAAYFQAHRPDFLKIAPSHLRALLDVVSAAALCPRKALILGGEILHRDLAARLLGVDPPCAIWNHYGPTETTVGVLTHLVDEQALNDAWHDRGLPLGRPLPGVEVAVLDPAGQPAPIGVSGELHVGGPLVARGYLNRPDQTVASFYVEHGSGLRFYRTGDQVRRRADGVIEFLGRTDQQVKIRGWRVELGEIEAALDTAPEIADRAVLLLDQASGAQRLVAYLVPRNATGIDLNALDRRLRTRLPEVMIPSAYVVLDALPRTAHGKIDRAALRRAQEMQIVSTLPPLLPRTPDEQLMALVWDDVLGVETIDVRSNFFALGGHSLLAIRVVARIASIFHVDIPVRALFEYPHLDELTTYVMQQRLTHHD